MKKKAAPLEKMISSHLEKIRWIANLDEFELRYISSKNVDKKDTRFNELKKNTSVAMAVVVDYDYLNATIGYNDKQINEMYRRGNYAEIVGILCHEVAHVITSEPFDIMNVKYKGRGLKAQERLTERVGRLIYRLYMKFVGSEKINMRTGHQEK